MAKESGIAKSLGDQKEEDMEAADQLLYNYLRTGKKISKDEANYSEHQNGDNQGDSKQSCDKCKFNLPAEQKCHIVEGKVNNEHGISKYFSPRGYGMLPGDIVWDYIKKGGKKLDFEKGLVINEAKEGFQCKDCKYYMYSHKCLLLKGTLEPEMSCAFIVKNDNGVEV
ncbi:MAG: hypothetical protein M3Z01_02260 [Thermoproteota archaeon]|nr:hypothetical protein [Thermoproteota archaeon]